MFSAVPVAALVFVRALISATSVASFTTSTEVKTPNFIVIQGLRLLDLRIQRCSVVQVLQLEIGRGLSQHFQISEETRSFISNV